MADDPDLERRLGAGDPRLFRGLLDVLAEAVTIRAPDGRLVYANRAALAFLGFPSLEALRERSTADIMSDYIVVQDVDGRPLGHPDVPSVRLLEGAEVEPLLIRTVHRSSGAVRWVLLTTTPLDHDGEMIGAITEIRDLTAVKSAELRTQVLADSGRLLASSLDYEATLATVAGLAVPDLADACSVDLIGPEGELVRVAAVHVDHGRRSLSDRLATVAAGRLAADHALQNVLRSGDPLFLPDATESDLRRLARGDEHADTLAALDIRSVIIVPLRVANRSIGLMTFATDVSLRRLAPDDVELAAQLGRRAAVAVENARLHEKLADVAETLQSALVPAEPPDVNGWEIASLYRPIETELRIDVGGDFYEFFEHDGVSFVILGDVAGKGVTVASVTALLRHGARVASRAEPSPATILTRLDEALAEQPGRPLATAVCMCLHPDHVVISSAGHHPALIAGSDESTREAPASDPMLGAFPRTDRHEETVPIGRDDLLVLYTDGVIDARGADRERFRRGAAAPRRRRTRAPGSGRHARDSRSRTHRLHRRPRLR